MEHTPTPWTSDLSLIEQRGYGYIGAHITMADGKRIALDFYGTSFDETVAAVNLMASAPALLSALEALMPWTGETIAAEAFASHSWQTVNELARAAILAAKGEANV